MGAAKAHSLALDVRKFEIELYWKRATYFWAFTGAAFAGYLSVLTGKDVVNRSQALLLVSCLGLIFAVAWYFVNRASKYWQLNWEVHVDLLEDEVMGPVYKTVLNEKFPWWKINAPYPFSVTKINQLLSFFVAAVFGLLVVLTLCEHYSFTFEWRVINVFPTACIFLTATFLVLLCWFGRADKADNKVAVRLRKTELVSYDDSK